MERIFEQGDWPALSNVFLKGHEIRIEVSSSNFPKYDRNPNTGHKFGEDSEILIARQKVFHERDRASYMSLPVIPSGSTLAKIRMAFVMRHKL